MPQTFAYQSTGTAADLIAYEKYTDPSKGDRISRSMNDYQEWLVQARDGEVFYVTFKNNFSKKHLVTDSKKTVPTSTDKKIQKLLDHRSKADQCKCSPQHKYSDHHHIGKWCKKCGCQKFKTPHSKDRASHNKPDQDPLAGAKTTINTCIMMNKVQKQKFEDVVVNSILVHEKPATWQVGNPLEKKINDLVVLKWDFNTPGAVVQAANN